MMIIIIIISAFESECKSHDIRDGCACVLCSSCACRSSIIPTATTKLQLDNVRATVVLCVRVFFFAHNFLSLLTAHSHTSLNRSRWLDGCCMQSLKWCVSQLTIHRQNGGKYILKYFHPYNQFTDWPKFRITQHTELCLSIHANTNADTYTRMLLWRHSQLE